MKVVFITLLIVGIFYASANDLRLVKERIRYLENRVNSESKFRHEDYSEIIHRLDEIDRVLNASLDHRVSRYDDVLKEAGETSSRAIEHLKQDFTQIRKAFSEEQTETARIRREIANLGNNFKTVQEEMDNYCKISLNKTEKVISNIETNTMMISEVSAKQIAVYEKLENVNELTDISLKLEQVKQKTDDIEDKTAVCNEKIDAIAANVEISKVNMERAYSLVAELSTLLRKSSCIELLNNGITQSGTYTLQNGIMVYCDQTTDGGGWIVFQRRLNGKVDFHRNWTEYKNGFGDLNGDFWLGNEHLSLLTAVGEHELRIELHDTHNHDAIIKYSKFRIYPEFNKYILRVSGFDNRCGCGDSLEYHNGMQFSTFDNDNDKHVSNCAATYGAWWHNSCYRSNLNGKFADESDKGMKWNTWRTWKWSFIKTVEMKFR